MTLFPELDRTAAKLEAETAAAHDAARGLEEDLTPRGVAGAVLRATFGSSVGPRLYVGADTTKTLSPVLMGKINGRHMHISSPVPVIRALGLCTGFGVWESELRKLSTWPTHITGLEIDPSKREHATKWCDEVVVNDVCAELREMAARGESADFAFGNPAFTLLAPPAAPKRNAEKPGAYEARLDRAVEGSLVALALKVAPALLLFTQTQSFQRGRVGREIWRRYPPAVQWLVAGTVDFRGGNVNPKASAKAGKPVKYGADTHDYCATLWLRRHTGPTQLVLLPELASSERKWFPFPGARPGDVRQQPGTETLEQALAMGMPLAPGIGQRSGR
jgi:hypothetical protein